MATRQPRLSLPQRETDYEVGYGKPPQHTQFQKGRSGNPKGRKKGSKNRLPNMNDEPMQQIILEEAYRDIHVREGEKQVTLPVIRAAVRTLANKGLKGETRSLKHFMELVAIVEGRRQALSREFFETLVVYKDHWERELDRRRRLGITDLPEPQLHPDDVIIDPRTGEARIAGPMTRDEAELWSQARDEIVQLKQMIELVDGRLHDDPDNQDMVRLRGKLQGEVDEFASVSSPRWMG